MSMILLLLIVHLRLGLITINALTAADSVIIPVQCEYFALEGLGKLLNTIKIVQSRLNTHLEIEGILLTMYDVRLRLSTRWLKR
jgi:chromosome partitioning protein